MDLINTRQNLLDLQTTLVARIKSIDSGFARRRSPDFSEQATEQENEEVLVNLKNEAESELRNVNLALHKLNNGIYGECERCHKDIGEKRLNAIPFAQLCIDCA